MLTTEKTKLDPIKSINPYSGKEVEKYDQHTDEDLDGILSRAKDAFESWQETLFSERAEIFRKIAKDLKENSRQYGELITREMGKPIKQSISEVEKCAWACEFYADNAAKFLEDKVIETDAEKSYVSYEPLGTVLAVMPWNFPLWQVFRFAVPTLMAGNTGLLKHASISTGCALLIEKIFHNNGIPKDAFRTLVVSSSRMDPIIQDDRLNAVTLTGSEGAGSSVGEVAGKNLKPSVLELGGSNPFIVLEDADMEKAVDAAIFGRFQNTGQSCIASKRFMIHESIYDEFMQRFVKATKELKVGDPMDEETFIGPLASASFVESLHDQVQEALEKGATLKCGGEYKDTVYQPTILEGVEPGMKVFDEETFGPVAACMKIRDFEEAIDLTNKSRFGLGASVFTTNVDKVLKQSKRIEDGAVFFNSFVKSDPRLPFGGTKKSGYGRELSKEGIMAFVNKKTVYIA